MSEITWLHFSDLHHCGPKTGWEVDRVLDMLRQDLQTLQQTENLRPDLIFFTGDAVFGHLGEGPGKSITGQFEEVGLLFDEIRESFTPVIPKDRFFIVPGNHDVNRSKVSEMFHAGLESALAQKESYEGIQAHLTKMIHDNGLDWKTFMERLSDYRHFLQEQGYNHLLDDIGKDPDRLIYTEQLDIGGIKVGIAGFNTAWSCYKEEEHGKLRMAGHWQLEQAYAQLKSADLKIALTHHPTDWLHQSETRQVKKRLETDFNFFLHGHDHDNWVTTQISGTNVFHTIASGATHSGSDRESGYNITRLNLTNNTGKIWLREYKETGWIPCNIHGQTENGVQTLETVRKQIDNPTKPQTKPQPQTADSGTETGSQNQPSEQKHETSGTANETEQQNQQSHQNESGASTTPQRDQHETAGVFGRQKEIELITGLLEKKKILTIYGLSGIGKSVVIREICRSLQDRYETHSIVMSSNTGMEDLFMQMARVLGCRKENPKPPLRILGQTDYSELKKYAENSQPTIIHLDNAQLLFKEHAFKDDAIPEFLQAVVEHNPKIRIISESRSTPPTGSFPGKLHKATRIKGIDCESMALYFQHPFKDRPNIGWTLKPEEAEKVYQLLGGKDDGFAHPLAMNLLAIVADGNNESPFDVWSRHQDLLYKELEEKLFAEIYDDILQETERHMLRLCSLYRERIPFSHIRKLEVRVEDTKAFPTLIERCLITDTEAEMWFHLHSIISKLTQSRIEKETKAFYRDHAIIADAWLEFLNQMGSYRGQQKIKATNEAFFHLHMGKCQRRYQELSVDLLKKNVVKMLEADSDELRREKKFKERRSILELIVNIDPENHMSLRFLGETIQKLEGKGSDKALECFKKAQQLNPRFYQYLANLGNCLLARDEAQEFIEIVEALNYSIREKVLHSHALSVYIRSFASIGEHQKASDLRQEQIREKYKNPVFYNDEAKWLAKQPGREGEALQIIQKAEEAGCADEYILSVKASILEQIGEDSLASELRMEQIQKGVKDSIFYSCEAKYLLEKRDKADEALAIIQQAEAARCTDEYIVNMKKKILRRMGSSL